MLRTGKRKKTQRKLVQKNVQRCALIVLVQDRFIQAIGDVLVIVTFVDVLRIHFRNSILDVTSPCRKGLSFMPVWTWFGT
jgi:hypothetical protein